MQQPTIQIVHNVTLADASVNQFPNLQHDLMQVFHSLQSSLLLLFLRYKPYVMFYESYIKLGILLVLMYAFYKLGGITVTDKIESEKENLGSLIVKKNSVKQQIPKKIIKIKSTTNRILFLCVLLGAGYAYASYTGHQLLIKDLQTPIVIGASLMVFYIIYSNIEKLILSKRLQQISKLQLTIAKKLEHFTTSLGPKVITILKNHLCRQLQIKFYSSKNINECQKQNCKEVRILLKQKNDTVAALVEETADFEWCSICKKKTPFDEHLHFQPRPYPAPETENQSEQVKNKMGYLIDGLERMRKWLNETSPCNCSKLYWTTSTRHIIEFKKTQKLIDAKMKQIQARNKDKC